MSIVKIATIVEGHGEVVAVPRLLQKIKEEFAPELTLITPVIRLSADKIKHDRAKLQEYIQIAADKIDNQGGILVLVDADSDCPATLGPALLQCAREVHSSVPLSVVLAKGEYESWFIAAAESLRGREGFPIDLAAPDSPETVQGAKEWLGKKRGRKYTETLDQAKLTSAFDMEMARSASPSFDKLFRDVTQLLTEITQTNAQGAG